METILDIILIFACTTSIVTNLVYLFSVKKLNRAADLSLKDIPELRENQSILLKDFGIFHSKVDSFLSKSDQLLQEPTISPNRPIKPNNWDSMREAFKGPARVELNE